MSQQQTINLLICIQTFFSLLIATRAFYLYTKNRSDDLFILGVAMLTISATGITAFIADNFFASPQRFGGIYNTLWFVYGGDTASYFFIFLSTLQRSDSNPSHLKRWQMFVTALLALVLLATPIIPPFPSPNDQAILNNARSLVCFINFGRYSYFFFKKESRFNFLMTLAFFLLTFGYIIVTAQYYHSPIIDIYIGYALRISGLIALFLAFWIG